MYYLGPIDQEVWTNKNRRIIVILYNIRCIQIITSQHTPTLFLFLCFKTN